MQGSAHPFDTWESFYVIVGSSAAALTGLQFVVITLVKDAWRSPNTNEIGAFSTPTIFHFCAALWVSATLSAPWPGLVGPRLTIGASGVTGIAYAAIITWRATHSSRYTMVLEDWVWHVTLPIVAYVAMTMGAFLLDGWFDDALFVIAGATILLLYIGIHNAWDTTTYVASGRAARDAGDADGRVGGEPARAAAPEPATASSSPDRQ